ncbi:hypothetical protein S7711_03182 [Stachybotrys chartarum IBT 7711]|uniref:Uncharacterized protein n=1 Tax=Stachybotrys chartarum (strain CBS 109288 / IBT 7711) TaxID=1280523 RepID=A0A084AWL7_STACB|nr:hypothetical protein S7711_03182 [Stachybotrys chartarum IBT 7711]
MSPLKRAAGSREEELLSVIEFAADVHSTLQSPRGTKDDDLLLADVSHHAKSCAALSQRGTPRVASKTAKSLERNGRDLWNLCVRFRREHADQVLPESRARLLTRVRLFAYQLIALAREGGRSKQSDEAGVMYMANLAINVGRLCLEDMDIESAKWALEKAAEHLEHLKELSDKSGSTSARICDLEGDFLVVRIVLAWKQDRLDVAEHMFNKTTDLQRRLSVASTENMADSLLHIGQSLSSKNDDVAAIKWLKRACGLLNAQDLDKLSISGLDLRLAISHTLIKSFLNIGSTECVQEANDVVALVESGIGDKPVVLHWRLEILQRSPRELFDIDAYTSIIRRMIRTFDFSHGSLHFILYHVKELADKTPILTTGLLDELLLQRVLPSQNPDWISKTIVRRIWVATMDTYAGDSIPKLRSTLDRVCDSIGGPVGPDAAGACHSLLWQKMNAAFVVKDYKSSVDWAQVALHPSFSSCGDSNRAKFGRKLILCALGTNSSDAARAAFENMPASARDDTLTRYLMFKVALQSWDHELGCECVGFLSKSAVVERSQDILYACVREAQQAGDKLCTLAALKAVVSTWDSGQPPTTNLPSLFRCAIRLIHLIEDNQEDDAGRVIRERDFVEDTCVLFEKEIAAYHAKQKPRDNGGQIIFTIPELHWFRKNAYNIGVSNCHEWEMHPLMRIFSICLDFIHCYPRDLALADVTELNVMAMRCHFVLAAALVSQARTEDVVAEQLQRYLELRQHAEAYDLLMHSDGVPPEEEIKVDLVAKLSTLLVLDFEAAVCLKDWGSLGEIVRKARACKDEAAYKAMGDCLLRCVPPGKVLFATLQLIVNEIFALEQFDSDKLAKYVRCIFQAILPLDDALAMQLLDQALQIAREGKQVARPFPSTELDWLVATSFNHAIDFYARGDEDPCHRWALKAMDLAEYMDDQGSLRDMLQERFAKLKFTDSR